ncbi:MAG: peptidase S41, partial [Robiginitalea sp.]
MKNEILITFLFFLLFQSYRQSNASFSKEEIRADLDVLRESLQEAHYNLYAYTTAQEFEAAYQRAKGEINQDSISLLETTNIFQRFISVINTGHSEIDFPGQSYREYAYAGGTVFPLEIAFEGAKALIRKNWSGNDSLVL